MLISIVLIVVLILIVIGLLCVIATQTSKRKFKAKIQMFKKVFIEVESES